MKMCTVVAFDPGETTGWAVIQVKPDWLTEVNHYPSLHEIIHTDNTWTWGQIDAKHLGSNDAGVGANRGHDALNFPGENLAVVEMLNITCGYYPDSAIVLEKFVLDPKMATGKFDLLAPVRIISAFSFGLDVDWRNDTGKSQLNRLNLIQRSDPKRVCTNERLKRWGFGSVVSHRNRHACDATRIAYHFLRDCRGQGTPAQERRWQAWPRIFKDPQISKVEKAARKPRPLGERL